MPTEPKYWPSGGLVPVPSITSAASAFIIEHSRLLDFDEFFAKGMLDKLDAIRKGSVAQSLDSPLVHNSLLLELVLTRTVDNFLCFLSDLLDLPPLFRAIMN